MAPGPNPDSRWDGLASPVFQMWTPFLGAGLSAATPSNLFPLSGIHRFPHYIAVRKDLQVASFQRWNVRSITIRREWHCSFPHLLLLMILQPCHLPPPLRPVVSNSSCLFPQCQSLNVSCCTVLLYFSRCCTIRLKMLSLFFVFVLHVLFVWKVL